MYSLPIGTLMHIARARGIATNADKVTLGKKVAQSGGRKISSSDRAEWLSTGDINRVLRATPGIDYLGTHPNDFPEFTNLLTREYPKGKTYAAVFNTDTSSGPGEHWVAIAFDDSAVCFFDSTGDLPSQNIRKLIAHTGRRPYINKLRHQAQNTECGIFAIHFIQEFAAGKTCTAYFKTIKGDAFMKDQVRPALGL